MAQALNLLRAGYNVTVWNRTHDKADALVEAGAHVSGSWTPVPDTPTGVAVTLLFQCRLQPLRVGVPSTIAASR